MKNIKKMLVLMLVTSFTFLASCSKDDSAEDNIAFGDLKVTVDGEDFTVNSTSQVNVYEGQLNQDTGKREDRLSMSINSSKGGVITIYIDKLTEAKSYTTDDAYTYITFSESRLTADKSKSAVGYFATYHHNKTSTIEVLELDKTNKRIKVKFNATLANSEGETKTINTIFYKDFVEVDR